MNVSVTRLDLALYSLPRQATRCLLIVVGATLAATAMGSELEARFFKPPVQITTGASKAGEGYFSPDARLICYQAVPQGYPFYQIFVQPIDLNAPRPTTPVQISTGRGRTTCSWFSPDGKHLLFASSHLDPAIDTTEQDALRQAAEDAASGRRRRYAWDFDPWMDIFTAPLDGPASGDQPAAYTRLTSELGYDAECSFSPDGSQVLFVSDRDGDPDIYLMRTDGSDLRQLTNQPGYDGGPFFSPDGRWITYRTDRLEKDQLHIHVMRADGSGDRAVTAGQSVEWAPYWHPSKPWLIWTGADHSDPMARPNYDLWVARYTEADANDIQFSTPLRLTDHASADVLPVFSPDGRHLLWTTGRSSDLSSQLWLAELHLDAIDAAIDELTGTPQTATP
jgi:TolB protein